MKVKVIFISFLCYFVLQANAQISNNTIVNDNSSWAVLNGGVCIDCPVWTQYIYFEGDSVFNGKTYKKVFSCNDTLHKNIKYEGLIREQDEKTYFIPFNFETEYLLYDFSLEEGMIFETQEIQLYVKVSFVNINGVQKKQIQLTSLNDHNYICDTWIEGIGSLNSFFEPGISPPGVKRKLLCHFQNN